MALGICPVYGDAHQFGSWVTVKSYINSAVQSGGRCHQNVQTPMADQERSCACGVKENKTVQTSSSSYTELATYQKRDINIAVVGTSVSWYCSDLALRTSSGETWSLHGPCNGDNYHGGHVQTNKEKRSYDREEWYYCSYCYSSVDYKLTQGLTAWVVTSEKCMNCGSQI